MNGGIERLSLAEEQNEEEGGGALYPNYGNTEVCLLDMSEISGTPSSPPNLGSHPPSSLPHPSPSQNILLTINTPNQFPMPIPMPSNNILNPPFQSIFDLPNESLQTRPAAPVNNQLLDFSAPPSNPPSSTLFSLLPQGPSHPSTSPSALFLQSNQFPLASPPSLHPQRVNDPLLQLNVNQGNPLSPSLSPNNPLHDLMSLAGSPPLIPSPSPSPSPSSSLHSHSSPIPGVKQDLFSLLQPSTLVNTAQMQPAAQPQAQSHQPVAIPTTQSRLNQTIQSQLSALPSSSSPSPSSNQNSSARATGGAIGVPGHSTTSQQQTNNRLGAPSSGGVGNSSNQRINQAQSAAYASLQSATSSNTSSTSSADTESRCVICLDSKKNTVLYQCGHACVCYPCGQQLVKRKQTCPICRSPIIDCIKIYQ